MFQEEITRYTKDPDVLKMTDFKKLADSCGSREDFRDEFGEAYDEAASRVYDVLFSAIRVAQWAQRYRGVHIDADDLKHLKDLLNDLKADESLEKHD